MLDHFYTQLKFSEQEKRPFVAMNMVTSLDGKVTSGGKLDPGSLGSAFDRHTMNIIRSHFDAVLTGGNTIRQHPYYLGVPKNLETERIKRGLVPQPLTVLLTTSGQLDPSGPIFLNPPRPPLIFTSAHGEQNLPSQIKSVAVVEILHENAGPETICKIMQSEYGVNRLLLEGGPQINYMFCQARHLDQLFLTLAPRLVGTRKDLTMIMGPKVLPKDCQVNLLSIYQNGEELFLRYAVTWPA